MTFLLSQLVSNAAERFPDHDAVHCGTESLTYGDLDARSNSLARVLINQGINRGDRVGIFMNKSLESVIAVYGILKAGAAYVPLDPFAPVARLGYVIRDCGIRYLVTKEQKLNELHQLVDTATDLEGMIGVNHQGDLQIKCISWDEVFITPTGAVSDVGIIEQDLAYILYTSGSTGDPKGIMHTHRSGLSFVEWVVETYSLRSSDRLSNHAPFHFDLSILDLFCSAFVGATMVIIPETMKMFPASLSKLIQDQKITIWYSVPFALIQLLLRGGIQSRDLSALRWVLFAGEVFPTKHLRHLMKQLPHARFSNLYGPTETNVCTYYHVSKLPEDSDEPIPIGKPCGNVEGLVVDSDDQPLPRGEVGELLIRGPIVMRGYWGRPDLTERGFFRRTVFSHYEDIFYRTGDLVQLQRGGNYAYLGRKDRQVKTRGYRVELDEIEVVMLAHEHVEEAAVYTVPDGQGSNLIEAAAVAKQGTEIDESVLMSHLSDRLPSYAVPTRIIIIDVFPRTSTGKINRRELQDRAKANTNNAVNQQN